MYYLNISIFYYISVNTPFVPLYAEDFVPTFSMCADSMSRCRNLRIFNVYVTSNVD